MNLKSKKVIYVDLDGTFLENVNYWNHNKKLREHLVEAKRMGYEIVVCSGRPEWQIKEVIKANKKLFNKSFISSCNKKATKGDLVKTYTEKHKYEFSIFAGDGYNDIPVIPYVSIFINCGYLNIKELAKGYKKEELNKIYNSHYNIRYSWWSYNYGTPKSDGLLEIVRLLQNLVVFGFDLNNILEGVGNDWNKIHSDLTKKYEKATKKIDIYDSAQLNNLEGQRLVLESFSKCISYYGGSNE